MKKDYKTRENNEELDGSLSSTIVVQEQAENIEPKTQTQNVFQ